SRLPAWQAFTGGRSARKLRAAPREPRFVVAAARGRDSVEKFSPVAYLGNYRKKPEQQAGRCDIRIKRNEQETAGRLGVARRAVL
ncbi:unnamed protein product, partial [Amoebophrya sp. A120]